MTQRSIKSIIGTTVATLIIAAVAISFPAVGSVDAAPLALSEESVNAYTSGFTYQGSLSDGGEPANGLYDFRFEILADGGVVGAEYEADNVMVTDGLFATTIGVTGAGIWNGQRRFLSIAARKDGETDYIAIGTSTEMQPAPYAFHAKLASFATEANSANSAKTLSDVGDTVLQVGNFNMFQGGTSETMDFAARGTGRMQVTYSGGTDVGFVYLPVDVPTKVLGFNQKLKSLSFCYSGAADNGIGPLAGIDWIEVRQVDKMQEGLLLTKLFPSYQTNSNECVNITAEEPVSVTGSVWIQFRVIVSNTPLEFGEVKLTFVNG